MPPTREGTHSHAFIVESAPASIFTLAIALPQMQQLSSRTRALAPEQSTPLPCPSRILRQRPGGARQTGERERGEGKGTG